MTDITTIATIARDNAISIEAKLTRHSKRADGGLNIGLAVHPHGIPAEIRDAPLGTRYMVVLVELTDTEEPKDRQVAQNSVAKQLEHKPLPDVARKVMPRRATVAPEKRLAMRAGILCTEPAFWRFINEQYERPCSNEAGAAEFIRFECQVASRAEIQPGTPEGEIFHRIDGQYEGWRRALDDYQLESV